MSGHTSLSGRLQALLDEVTGAPPPDTVGGGGDTENPHQHPGGGGIVHPTSRALHHQAHAALRYAHSLALAAEEFDRSTSG